MSLPVIGLRQSWRDDLEEREERVEELERKMVELEAKKNDTAEEWAHLGEIVEEQQGHRNYGRETRGTRLARR